MQRPALTKHDITRKEIVREAKTLFQAYGIGKTTMGDIAEAAAMRQK